MQTFGLYLGEIAYLDTDNAARPASLLEVGTHVVVGQLVGDGANCLRASLMAAPVPPLSAAHASFTRHTANPTYSPPKNKAPFLIYSVAPSTFYPRDAMRKRGLCYGNVSVCHTPVLCLNDYTYLKTFSTIW